MLIGRLVAVPSLQLAGTATINNIAINRVPLGAVLNIAGSLSITGNVANVIVGSVNQVGSVSVATSGTASSIAINDVAAATVPELTIYSCTIRFMLRRARFRSYLVCCAPTISTL